MAQLTERDADKLSPEQATALVRLLALQASWDVLLTGKDTSHHGLLARQKANDAYQLALRDYGVRYRNARILEPTQAMPDRLATWCRTLRSVLRVAAGGCPPEVMGQVYRLADRIALRTGKEPLKRGPADDLPAAVRALESVIAWCGPITPAHVEPGAA